MKSKSNFNSNMEPLTALRVDKHHSMFFSFLAFRLLLQLLLLAILPNPTTIFTPKPIGFSIDLIHRDSSLRQPTGARAAPPALAWNCATIIALSTNFGEDTEFSGKEDVQKMLMAPGSSQGMYYVLNLTDISIGNIRLNIQFGGAHTTALLGDASLIIIDSGTTMTYLAKDVYDEVSIAVAKHSASSYICFYLQYYLTLPTTIFTSKHLGFSVDLFHRDSSLPPLYDPSSTLAQLVEQASLLSMLCSGSIVSRFANATSMISSPVMPGPGEFLVKLSLDTLVENGADTIKHEGIVFGCVHSEDNPDSAFKENNSMGQLKFDEDTEFSGAEEVQETLMASDGSQGSFYVLNLTDISIGNSRLNIQFGGAETPALLGDARSIIIELGSVLTSLAKDVYDQVANVVANVINHERFYSLEQDSLCYHVKINGDRYEGLPEMTFHFTNADWKLPPSNIFMMFESEIDCLAIKDGQMPIFGNIVQQNMHVKFYLGKRLFFFAPTKCTKARGGEREGAACTMVLPNP
ncbi:hypothetical protein EJ110_NYTH18334 [Nymphaea thermarum]|nr:hypothetical protein EJ110_NYTH18334 [Nymphaea thermarum]